MKIEGKVWKDGKFWIVSIPGLDLDSGHDQERGF